MELVRGAGVEVWNIPCLVVGVVKLIEDVRPLRALGLSREQLLSGVRGACCGGWAP